MSFTIKFIGVSGGIPSKDFFHSSFMLNYSNYKILFDCGEGSTKALLKYDENPADIDAIIISHFHADHSNGISGLLTYLKNTDRKKALKIIVHHKSKEFLLQILKANLIFFERFDFKIEIIEYEWVKDFFLFNQVKIKSFKNNHLEKYRAFCIEEDANIFSSSFVFFIEGTKIAASGDINSIDDLLFLQDVSCDILILESAHIKIDDIVVLRKLYPPLKILLYHYNENFIEKFNELEIIKDSIVLAKENLILTF